MPQVLPPGVTKEQHNGSRETCWVLWGPNLTALGYVRKIRNTRSSWFPYQVMKNPVGRPDLPSMVVATFWPGKTIPAGAGERNGGLKEALAVLMTFNNGVTR